MASKFALLSVALLLILFLPSFLALEVTDLQQGVQENTTQLTQLKAETSARLSEINNKLDKFLTKEDMSKMLQAHLTVVDELLNAYKVALTVSWVITCLVTLGAFFGIYFYFKGKRRI